MPSAQRLREAHQDYLCAVTRDCSTPRSIAGDIAAIDTSAVARALSRLGADFAKPDVLGEIQTSPKDAADLVVELVLQGLARPTEEQHDDGGPRGRGR